MASRLFHTIVVYGAALGALPLSCAAPDELAPPAADDGGALEPGSAGAGGEVDRCSMPDGGCDEHCRPLADGGCLDPCFAHTEDCSPTCVQADGTCGWPPTK